MEEREGTGERRVVSDPFKEAVKRVVNNTPFRVRQGMKRDRDLGQLGFQHSSCDREELSLMGKAGLSASSKEAEQMDKLLVGLGTPLGDMRGGG